VFGYTESDGLGFTLSQRGRREPLEREAAEHEIAHRLLQGVAERGGDALGDGARRMGFVKLSTYGRNVSECRSVMQLLPPAAKILSASPCN
jgi:hypothetical protein